MEARQRILSALRDINSSNSFSASTFDSPEPERKPKWALTGDIRGIQILIPARNHNHFRFLTSWRSFPITGSDITLVPTYR